MDQCRPRSLLSVDELAEIILPFVSGLKWLNYNETTPTKRAPSLIVPLAPLYVQLRKAGGNLNFLFARNNLPPLSLRSIMKTVMVPM